MRDFPMRRLPLILMFCMIVSPLFAQVIDETAINIKITPPSPTAASLGKYGDMPVSYYTGIPQISIPLHEVKDRNLSLPVSLSYHAGGYKVEEKSSWVGRGWSLNAGGVITRVVRGLPDEMDDGSHLGYNLVRSKIRDLVNYTVAQKNLFYAQVASGYWDSEPDQFFYNFAGHSGRLYINDQDSVITVPAQNWKIIGSISEGFTITDEKGVVYSFGETEINEHEDACEIFITPPAVTSWYLGGITTPTGESITFGYENGLTYHDITPSESIYQITNGACANMNNTNCLSMNRTSTLRLFDITSGKTRIKFNARTKRTDLGVNSNEYRLDDIELFYNDSLVKKTKLYYGTGTSGNMRLDSVQELGYVGSEVTQKRPYGFEYYNIIGGANVKSQDHWGFYTSVANGLIPPGEYVNLAGVTVKLSGTDRSPDLAGTRSGVLNKIIYPTGGSTTFDYELNDYGYINKDSLHEKELLNANTTELIADPSNMTSEEVFIIDYKQLVDINYRVNIGPNPNIPYPSVNEYVQVVKLPGNTSVFVASFGSNLTYRELGPGTYKAITFSENPETSTAIQVSYKRYGNPLLKKKTGGLRVISIKDYDGINHTNDIMKTYNYTMSTDPARSSGVIMDEPKYDYYYTLRKYVGVSYTNCDYYVRLSVSKQLGSTQGGHIGYREVSVNRSDGARSLYAFTTFFDYPDETMSGFPFGLPTSHDYLRGLPLSVTDYKKSGNSLIPIRKVRNHYYQELTNHYQEQLAMKIGFQIRNPLVLTDSKFGMQFYYTISQWFYLDSTITTTYGPTGMDSLTDIVTYKYDNPQHMQLTRKETMKSSGEKQTAVMLYPSDYISGNAAIDDMKNKHLVGFPIESVMYEMPVGGTIPRILKGDIVQYKTGGKGLKLADMKLEIAAPVSLNAPGTTTKKYGPDGKVQKEFNKGHQGENVPRNERSDHVHDYKPNPHNPSGRGERQPGRAPKKNELKKDFEY